MSFDLRDYQIKTVSTLMDELRDARDVYVRRGKMSAIGLTAPTGAGKTVMAAAVIEALFQEDPELTVIWLSDAPELNRQSEAKILAAVDGISPLQMRYLSKMDQRLLDPGTVVFAHIQSLGRGATTMHAVTRTQDGAGQPDDRTFGVWDMLSNTIRERGDRVVLFVDEAHRGTGNGSTISGSERRSITQTVVHGGVTPIDSQMAPCPVVVGISATLQRFNDSMSAPTSRHSLSPVGVDLGLVRESGMIKDAIIVPRPAENQDADHTLLAAAAEELRTITQKWLDYHHQTGAPLVEPCMVVQIPASVPSTELAAILKTLRETWSDLTDRSVAHTFETHASVRVGSEEIRYVRPSDIASTSSGVKAVLFKSALTTGWDCPRAEVMVSLRGANDPTTIAQLIGRMVRTPLARRVDDGDEGLNAVTLYLPHYEPGAVAAVIEALTDDQDSGAGAEVRVATVDCPRNPAVPGDAFRLIASLPSYARPPRNFTSTTQRARRLAETLLDHDLADTPNTDLDLELLGAVRTEADKRGDEELSRMVDDILQLDMQRTQLSAQTGGYVATESKAGSLATAETDLARAFDKARRALPDNAAMLYYNTLDGLDERADRARIVALARIPEVTVAVEAAAARQITSWRDKYATAVQRLTRETELRFVALWSPTGDVIQADLILPDPLKKVGTQKAATTNGKRTLVDLDRLPKHLFVLPGTDEFPIKYGSTWEEHVLSAEVGQPTVVGWYRNPSRGANALAVPYELDGETGLVHPDFLFVRDPGDGHYVVDVVDPHLHSNADTGPKWRGLASWAAEHGDADWLGRVVAVIEVDGALRALDLRNPEVRLDLERVRTKVDIERVFAARGTAY